MADGDIAERVTRRLSTLKGDRQPYEARWSDCYRYTFPERMGGLQGADQASINAGQNAARAEIYDDTATESARTQASSFSSGLTPANSLWFGLVTGPKEQDDAARWLADCAQYLFDFIHGGNFDAASFECYIDLAAGPGMFYLYVEQASDAYGRPMPGFRFEQLPFGECYAASSKVGGRVDTIYREFRLTVEQIVAEYGIDNVSDPTAQKYRQNERDSKVDVVWCIEPRDLSKQGPQFAKNKRFASYHIESGQKKVLREGGYDEFPVMAPRWMLIPGTAYATGPMAAALATVKTLNELKKLELTNLEMNAYGMYKATDDGVLNPFTTKIGPRRIVVVADMANFAPIVPSGNFDISFQKAGELQASIRKLMLADQLHPADGPAMTATEVHARINLIRQQLGPLFARLQAEYLQPLIDRCFGIAWSSGALIADLGVPPDSLRGKTLTAKYQSPLARAQRLEEVSAIDQWVQSIVTYVEATQDTAQLDEINTTEINRFRRDALGVPSLAQRKPEEVSAIRQQRQQAAQQAQQAAQQQEIQTEAGKAIATKLAAPSQPATA